MLLKGRHIFVVEDNPLNLAVIRTVLQNEGAYVPFDHWGDTTLQKMTQYQRSFKLDMILLDIMLPHKISGYDILEAIKSTSELKGIPVVAVTASDPDSEIPKARARGFNGYICKPINRNEFPEQILTTLKGGEIWGT